MRLAPLVAAAGLAGAALPAAASAAVAPSLIWPSGGSLVVGGIAAGAPAVVTTTEDLGFPALADGRVVGTRTVGGADGSDAVVVRRASDGHLLRVFKNAFAAVPMPGGATVAFADDRFGIRDPANDSIWLGTVKSGAVRRIRKIDGPGAGAYRPGIEAATLISMTPRLQGGWLALTWGNDVDIFQSDVLLVRVSDGLVRRLTKTHGASYPDWSPNGKRVVYVESRGAHLTPGDLAGSLTVRNASGTGRRVLLHATTKRFWASPRWVAPNEIDAIEMTAAGGSVTSTRLVRIDVAAATRTTISTGVSSFSPLAGGTRRVENRFSPAASARLAGGPSPIALPGVPARAAGDRGWPGV